MVKKNPRVAGRQIGAVSLALALVITAIAGAGVSGPVGSASAVHAGDCGEFEAWAFQLTIGIVASDQCEPAHLSESYNELEDAHENATEVSIYSTGQSTAASNEQYLTAVDNALIDSETVAMSKAEEAAIDELNADGDRSEVQQAAVEAVEDHYAIKQINLADRYGVSSETVYTLDNTSDAAGLDQSFVHMPEEDVDPETGNIDDTTTVTSTLVNGSDYAYTTFHVSWTGGHGQDQPPIEKGEATGTSDHYSIHVTVEPVEGQTSYEAMNLSEFAGVWDETISNSERVEDNAESYAGSLYNATEDGNASVADYVSGQTLAQEYSTDYEETGYYSYAVGMGAASGLATPDLGAEGLMTISSGGESYEGLLMSSEPPESGEFEVDTPYHTADINGSQFVATTGGNTIELEGSFTITSMADSDGNPVNSTTVEENEYETTNVSEEYGEIQDDLRALRTEIEDVDPGGGSGGGDGGFDFGLGGTGIIVVIAAVAVFLLGRN